MIVIYTFRYPVVWLLRMKNLVERRKEGMEGKERGKG
jgi:hypothetical protein